MQRWEYLEILVYGAAATAPAAVITNEQKESRCEPANPRVKLWVFLNQLGHEGWEMVAHTHLGGNYRMFHFKRVLDHEPPASG